MTLSQAIFLISHPRISNKEKSIWADFGCGTGLFTNALTSLIHPASKVYAIDSDPSSFRQAKSIGVSIEKVKADFVRDDLVIDGLDGILMANSLHFVTEKVSFIQKSTKYLNDQGRFIIVEYNTDTPNPWVPYPVSFHTLQNLFNKLGYNSVLQINEIASLYNRAGIYSALIER